MVTKKLPIANRLGIHLRPAAQLVNLASKYKCRILVQNHNGNADGKSLMSLLALAASGGSEVTLTVEGQGSKAALVAIQQLFLEKFGET